MSEMKLNNIEWMYVVTSKDASRYPFEEYPDKGERVKKRVLDKYRQWHRLIQAVEEYAHPELRKELRRIKNEIH